MLVDHCLFQMVALSSSKLRPRAFIAFLGSNFSSLLVVDPDLVVSETFFLDPDLDLKKNYSGSGFRMQLRRGLTSVQDSPTVILK